MAGAAGLACRPNAAGSAAPGNNELDPVDFSALRRTRGRDADLRTIRPSRDGLASLRRARRGRAGPAGAPPVVRGARSPMGSGASRLTRVLARRGPTRRGSREAGPSEDNSATNRRRTDGAHQVVGGDHGATGSGIRVRPERGHSARDGDGWRTAGSRRSLPGHLRRPAPLCHCATEPLSHRPSANTRPAGKAGRSLGSQHPPGWARGGNGFTRDSVDRERANAGGSGWPPSWSARALAAWSRRGSGRARGGGSGRRCRLRGGPWPPRTRRRSSSTERAPTELSSPKVPGPVRASSRHSAW
jgi:hypothetical protein